MPAKVSSHLLRTVPMAMRTIRSMLDEESNEYLSMPQLRLLRMINLEINQVSIIAKTLIVSQASVSKMVDAMEEKGYITRSSGIDKRVAILKLTSKGEKIHQSVQSAIEQKLEKLMKGLTKKNKEDLIAGLDVLNKVFSSESIV